MSWLAKLHAKQQAKKAAREATLTPLRWDYNDRAPGWTEVGQFFSVDFPAGCEPDPAVVAAIRQFCPDYVPLWVSWVFRTPWDTAGNQREVVYGRHVLARLVTDPKLTKHVFPGISPDVANYMERIFMEKVDHHPGESDLPGDYLPLNWALVESLRQTYGKFKELSPLEYVRELVLTPLQAKMKLAATRALERMGAQLEVRKYFQKQIDEMSEADMQKYALYGAEKKLPKEYVGLKVPTLPTATTGGN